MVNFVIRFFVFVTALLVVSHYVPAIDIDTVTTAIVIAFLLGALNTFIRPLLLLLFLPVNILTLGLFALSLNGIFFWFLSSIIDGFYVDGFLYGFVGAFSLSLLSAVMNTFLGVGKAGKKKRLMEKMEKKIRAEYEDEYDDDYDDDDDYYYDDDDFDDNDEEEEDDGYYEDDDSSNRSSRRRRSRPRRG